MGEIDPIVSEEKRTQTTIRQKTIICDGRTDGRTDGRADYYMDYFGAIIIH